MNKELYLWEVPRNLIFSPRRVKVIKECPKTYWLDNVCNKKVNKTQNRILQNYVGYTKYCLYYSTEEAANIAYKSFRNKIYNNEN